MAFTQWLLQLNIDSISVFGAAFILNVSIYVLYSYFFLHQTNGKALPLDMGVSSGDHRIIGDSRGFSGVPVALVIGSITWFLTGEIAHVVVAVGAYVGTIMDSFIKRRIGIERGAGLPILDQTDFILGAYLFVLPVKAVPFPVLLTALGQAIIIHSATNYLARAPWRSLTAK